MATPRLATSPPTKAVTEAAAALLFAHPDADVIFDETPLAPGERSTRKLAALHTRMKQFASTSRFTDATRPTYRTEVDRAAGVARGVIRLGRKTGGHYKHVHWTMEVGDLVRSDTAPELKSTGVDARLELSDRDRNFFNRVLARGGSATNLSQMLFDRRDGLTRRQVQNRQARKAFDLNMLAEKNNLPFEFYTKTGRAGVTLYGRSTA